jgi:hypothetical protein
MKPIIPPTTVGNKNSEMFGGKIPRNNRYI